MTDQTRQPAALVTGASRGIGRALAAQLAARGVRVALNCHRHPADAETVRAALPGEGHAVFPADVADADAAARLVADVRRAFGRLDILVNNAAIYERHEPAATSFADWRDIWRRTLDANLTGPANLSFLAAQLMRAQRGGRIVNISSRGAFRGEPGAPAYGASKAGLNALGQSLAKALAPEKIFVFTLAPGWVETDMAASHLAGSAGEAIRAEIPLGRVATADEVARAAAWLALDAPESMTGCILDLNGASYLRT
jgi:NAD(P)-dependent dehydrogenase (short-subunit alcohol dehydrogenase family)